MAPFRSPLLLGLVVLVGLAVVMAIPILPSKPEHTEVDFEAAPELNTLPAEASVPVSLPSDEDNVASAAPLPEEDSPRFEAIKNATAATNATNSSSSTNHTKPASTPAPTAKPTLPGTAPPSAIKDCMKWTELNATTKLHDPREDAFAFGKKGSSVVRVVGGCAEGNHITGCATKVLVFDVDKHSWKEEPIGLTNVNEFKSLGAGRCYNAKQDKVYDFGGTRTLGSNGPSKSNVLGVMSRNSIGGGWSWTKLAQTGAVPPVLQNPTLTCYGSFLILWGGFNSKGWYNQLYYADTTGNLAFQWFTPLFSGTTPSPRSGHSATLLGDKIYMFGGTDSVRMYQDLQVLTIPKDLKVSPWEWKLAPGTNLVAQPAARAFHSSLISGSRLYIMGGADGLLGSYFGDVHIYNLNSHRWDLPPASIKTGAASLPGKKVASFAAGKAGTTLAMFGGCAGSTCRDIFQPRALDTAAVCLDSCGAHGTFREQLKPFRFAHCECKPNWSGKFCNETAKCPGSCSGHGKCVEGTCTCNAGYGGVDCSLLVCPNNCGGRGTCSSAQQRCICKKGFWGLGCQESSCPNNCMGRGICQSKKTTGKNWCKCEPGFSGPGCEYWNLPTQLNATAPKPVQSFSFQQIGNNTAGNNNTSKQVTNNTAGGSVPATPAPTPAVYHSGYECKNHCSGHGLCSKVSLNGQTTGQCACIAGFAGVDCSGECSLHCSGPLAGRCTGPDPATPVCKCNKGFKGLGCASQYCPSNCSSHGMCKNNKCYCRSPWGGAACDVDTSCSGNGDYKHISKGLAVCVCKPGFGGPFCAEKVKCPDDCSHRGKCIGVVKDGMKHSVGVCKCNEGWRGSNCALKACPKGCSGHGTCDSAGICKCFSGYDGLGCERTLKCPKNCTGSHGVCVQDTDAPGTNKGVCKCNKGWAGDDCNDIGCPNACYHRGKCLNGHCSCYAGYSGKSCEKMCPNRCSKNGVCVDGVCKCKPGQLGADCGTPAKCPIDSKTKKECSGHGVCFRPMKKCFCAPGFTGKACATIHKCGAGSCLPNGRCVKGKCYCKPGYSGKQCEVKSTCPANCNNRGICQNGKCTCGPGFRGSKCEIVVSDTTCPKNCNSHGVCQNGKCFCASGWAGPDCSIATEQAKCFKSPSASRPCSGRGVCSFGKCFCAPGSAGQFCDQAEVCAGGCTPGQGICMTGKCRCFPGFKGDDCSEDMVCPGTPLPCSGVGVCQAGVCSCFPGYGGSDCSDILIDQHKPCPKDCSGRGVCTAGKCFCIDGFQGADCSNKSATGGCPEGCNGRGHCRFGQCYCRPGYAGPACENKVPCSAKCKENGVCAFGKCFCAPGYKGFDCTTKMTEEEKQLQLESDVHLGFKLWNKLNPYRNNSLIQPVCKPDCGLHGVCVGGQCVCEPDFYGAQCQIARGKRSCTGKTCGGHGVCIDGVCSCDPHFEGANCTKPKPVYCRNNCFGHGFCNTATRSCVCYKGYTGPSCNQRTSCAYLCEAQGHGVCINGQCSCVRGWTGPNCNKTTKATAPPKAPVAAPRFRETAESAVPFSDIIGLSECPSNCGLHGLCVNKQCYCKPGFSGDGCSKQHPVAPIAHALAKRLPAMHKLSGTPLSYWLLTFLAFGGGVLSMVAGQLLWVKHKERQRQHQTKQLLQPLLHSIDTN